MRVSTFVLLLIFLLEKTLAQTSPPNLSTLSIGQLMQGEAFVGALPEDVAWSEDSKTVYFTWNPDADTLRGTYKIEVAKPTAKPEKPSLEELKAMPTGGLYSRDFSKKVFSKNGDIFLSASPAPTSRKTATDHRPAITIKQITNTNEPERNPRFNGNETEVLYEKNDNLFAWNIAEGTTTQLTDLRRGLDRKDRKKTGEGKGMEADQLGLLAYWPSERPSGMPKNANGKPYSPSARSRFFTAKKASAASSPAPTCSTSFSPSARRSRRSRPMCQTT
jgi:hypothetical protein